ncbi:unnamed protein product [Pylaiella littoralis]
MANSSRASTVSEAEALGNLLMDLGYFYHVTRDHSFQDGGFFYRFADDEGTGGVAADESGKKDSWTALATRLFPTNTSPQESPQADLESVVSRDADMINTLVEIGVSPIDEHNTTLLDNVHPAKWQDAEPDGTYNLVAIGGGTGGLVSTAGAAGVYAKCALIENHLLGGDCLNVGCVPSKALISAARVANTVRNPEAYGVRVEGVVTVNFGIVMERLRKLRAGISHHDSAKRFTSLGIDVYIGHGEFTSPSTIEVNGKTLKFKSAVVATGGSAALPPIPGLKEAPYLTNASVFNLTALPKRLVVIGGGPIGLELAQAMQRFGSEVTVLIRSGAIMPKEDDDARAIVLESLLKDGMDLQFNLKFLRVEHTAPRDEGEFPTIRIFVEQGGEEKARIFAKTYDVFECEALLVATGRKPNVSNVGLEKAGVEFDTKQGVKVNDQLQTTNKNIYAVGDCCTKYQFTHAADFMARIVIRNALFFGKAKFSDLQIPWATFTEPEVAHVGLYPRDMEAKNIAFDTYTKQFDDNDRAILEGQTEGFVKIHVKKGTDRIIGATIVGEGAGDMISEVSVAMQSKVGLGSLAGVIHPYPTRAESIRQAGDLYNKTKLTPVVRSLFRNLMAIKR